MLLLIYTEIWLFLQMFAPHNRNTVLSCNAILSVILQYVRLSGAPPETSLSPAGSKQSMDSQMAVCTLSF